MLLLPACATKRTVKSVRPGKVSFDNQMWGGQGDSDSDDEEIKSKFAERGYTISEDGTIKADNNELFTNKSKLGNKAFSGKKNARIENRNAAKKAFRTPEYLKRNSYTGANKTASEGGLLSKLTGRTANETGMTVRKNDAGFLKRMNPFATNQYRGANSNYSTYQNRGIARSQANAPVADGIQKRAGFIDEFEMSVDGVKRLLNPNAYADARGL